jgi:hypothetical protein
MSAAGKKASPEMAAEPSAARALEILEAPERARRAADEAAEAELGLAARQVARQSLEQRLGFLAPYRAELDAWRAKQPRLGLGDLEESLGPQRRLYFDRALMVGADFSDRVGRAEAEVRRLSAALEQPLVGAPLDTAIRGVAELERQESGLKIARERWRGVRANTATQFGSSRRVAAALEAWMSLEEGQP